MENKITSRLGELGYLSAGIRLGIKDKETTNIDTPKIKLFNWANIKLFDEKKITEGVQEYPIRLEQKSKKGEIYIQKGDIVFSSFPSKSSDDNIIYIHEDIKEKYLYGETMFIFRLVDKYEENKDIMSKYIYLMLKSGIYNDYISELDVGYSHRLRPQMILNIEIPIIDEAEMKRKCNQYDEIRNKEIILKQQQQEFITDLYNINKDYKK